MNETPDHPPVFKEETHNLPNTKEEKEALELREKIRKLFDNSKSFLDYYAGNGGFKVECGDDLTDKSGQPIGTFAVDLDSRTLYYNTRYWTEKGFKPIFALKSSLHECEHIRELEELLGDKGGERVWINHQRELAGDEAYRIADNCYDDVKMDATVEERAPVVIGASKELVLTKQFTEPDMTELPRHLQFAYALKRDLIVGESSILSPEVREEFDALRHIRLESGEEVDMLSLYSRPQTKMKARIDFQEAFIRPVIDRLREIDKSDPRFQKKDGGNKAKRDKKGGKDSVGKEGGQFAQYYNKFWKSNPRPLSLSPEELKKLVVQIAKIEQARSKSSEEVAFEAYALKEGVSPTELKNYKEWKKKEIDTIIDKDTGETAISALRKEFQRIVKDRMKRATVSVFPKEEGDILVLPSEAVVAVSSGDFTPQVWEEQRTEEKKERKISNFDLHIVCDTSGSMHEGNGEKYIEQQKATMLLLEALQELYRMIYLEGDEIDEELSVRTEALVFGNTATSIKKLGVGLKEKDRVEMYKALAMNNGDTADFNALKSISDSMDGQTKIEIKDGERLKLVIVMTDGESNNGEKLVEEIEKLRGMGVEVVGVAITSSAKTTILKYAPDNELAESSKDLPQVFKRILNKRLASL